MSGVDCSGKSTQRELLTADLLERGHRVAGIWSRPGYSSGLSSAKKLIRRLQGKAPKTSGSGHNRSGQYPKRAEHLRKPMIRQLWLSLALTDLILQYGVRFRALRMLGKTVICDRYLLDCIVDFRVNFPDDPIEKSLLYRVLEKVAIEPDLSLCLLVPAELSLERGRLKSRSHWESARTLERRYAEYSLAGEQLGVIMIDAEQSIDEVADNIRQQVETVI